MGQLQKWAREEFGAAELGDKRRTERVVRMIAAMAGSPSGRVTSAIDGQAEQEAAFRVLRNESIRAEDLARSTHAATCGRLKKDEDYVVAIDQTGLATTDRANEKVGMGRAGSHTAQHVRGLQVMSSLAIRSDGTCLGICGQSWWRREEEKSPSVEADTRPLGERESILWHQALDASEEARRSAGLEGIPWYQFDRGADSWHVLERALLEGLQVTVRSAYDRAQWDGSGGFRRGVSGSKPLDYFRHYMRRGSAKRAGHKPNRARQLAVRAKSVELRLTTTGTRRVIRAKLWAVHVREKRPPLGSKRLEWFLLTTRPVNNRHDALKVARAYCLRWRIEEFHKTWKTGACDLESSQLRSAATFKKWATLHAAVAARIERMKLVSRNEPQASAREIASRAEIDTMIILATKKRLIAKKQLIWKPGDDMTAEDFVLLVAHLGGYTGRTSSGGPPGSITIRRGLDRLEPAVEALQAVGMV